LSDEDVILTDFGMRQSGCLTESYPWLIFLIYKIRFGALQVHEI